MTPAAHHPSTLPVVVALGTIYLVWGSTYLAIAYVVETLPPFLAAAARFLAAGVLLVGFLVAQDRWRRRAGTDSRLGWPTLAQWRTAAIVGGLLLLGGNGMVMVAEETVPSGIAAVIIATVPIWMSVFDALVTRHRPSLLAIGGLVAGLIGVAVLLLPSTGFDALDPFGIGVLVVAAVSWAAGSLVARYGAAPDNPLLGTGMQQLAGGLMLFVAGAALGEAGRFEAASVSLGSVIALVYLIVFGSLVGFTAYVWLLNNAPVTTVSSYAFVNPIIAVLLGLIFRAEPLTPRTLLAAAIIIGAVVAIVMGRPRTAPSAAGATQPRSEGRAFGAADEAG
jgi:drug/metabolite transporter (DMT)-like permease